MARKRSTASSGFAGASPLGMGIGVSFDTSKAIPQARELDLELTKIIITSKKIGDTFDDVEKKITYSMKSASDSASKSVQTAETLLNKWTSGLKAVGTFITSVAGVTYALMEPALKMSNYMLTINQRLAGGEDILRRYKNMILDVKQVAGKDEAFGLTIPQRQEIQMTALAQLSQTEKNRPNAEAQMANIQEGAATLINKTGMAAGQATELLMGLHRSTGLATESMGNFSSNLAYAFKNSNLTLEGFKKLTDAVSNIAIMYGKSNENAQKFVLNSVAVGSALTKLGLDATAVIKKMHQDTEGTEEGLIQDFILGINPDTDEADRAKRFESASKQLVSMANSMGPMFRNYFIQQLKGTYGLGNLSNEEITKIARGEQTAGNKQEDLADIAKQILAKMNTPAALDPSRITAGRAVEQITADIFAKGALQYEKTADDFVNYAVKFHEGFNEFADKIRDLIGSLGLLATAALVAGAALFGLAAKKLAEGGLKALLGDAATAGAGGLAGQLLKTGGMVGLYLAAEKMSRDDEAKTPVPVIGSGKSAIDDQRTFTPEDKAKFQPLMRNKSYTPTWGSGANAEWEENKNPSSTPSSGGNYDDIIKSASKTYGISEDQIRKIMMVESGGKSGVVSKKGAGGLMQIMPGTAKELGLSNEDRFNPEKAIPAGTKYYKQMLEQFGDPLLATAAYNMGPGALEGAMKGKREIPQETLDYVDKIYGTGSSDELRQKLAEQTFKNPNIMPVSNVMSSGMPNSENTSSLAQVRDSAAIFELQQIKNILMGQTTSNNNKPNALLTSYSDPRANVVDSFLTSANNMLSKPEVVTT